MHKLESRGYQKGYQSALRDIKWALENGGAYQVKEWLESNTLTDAQVADMYEIKGA